MIAECLPAFMGGLAALTAAALWAGAVAIYESAGKYVRPTSLNLLKCAIATVFFLVTLLCMGQLSRTVQPRAMLLLLLSGAIGLGVSDTALFKTLQDLGARRGLLFMILGPPLTAVMATVFLDEPLGIVPWCGIVMAVTGVAWVITERTPDLENGPKSVIAWRGILYGLVFAAGQASGAVLSRAAFVTSDVSPIWGATFRLLASVLFLTICVSATGDSMRGICRAVTQRRAWKWILPAVVFGTYIAIWLQQVSLSLTRAGIAQSLLATSPVFAIAVARIRGERITPRAILGATIALCGTAVLLVLPELMNDQ